MGVPGFYRWVCQRYPCVRHRLNDLAHPFINNLYIDFNSIIYNCLRFYTPDSNDDTEILFNEIGRYVDLLVQTIKPTSLIFIAVDGPAPLAKCAQQRTRRYMSYKTARPGDFLTAKISPGTEFMEKLNCFLREFIEERRSTDDTWKNPNIIYSDHRCPGEGEHKFFEYIRSEQDDEEWIKTSTHVIYSPDADLIFLGLACGLQYVYIMRNWDGWLGGEKLGNGEVDKLCVDGSNFELIHLPILREYLLADFPGVNFTALITDFVALSFLIGNDFIPHFPEIDISTGDFQSVLKAYRHSIMDNGRNLVVNGLLDREALQLFLREVGENTKPRGRTRRPDVSTVALARVYLKSKYMNTKKSYEEIERDVCTGVISAFDWVLEYYFRGIPSWSWQFEYLYTPPLILVAEYADYIPTFDLDSPPLPFEQLLAILPPQCGFLLPNPIKSLMFPPSDIAHFFPERFEVDLNGRRYEREGILLIPFVDMNIIRERVAAVDRDLSREERVRNSFSEDLYLEGRKPKRIVRDLSGVPSIYDHFTCDFRLQPVGVHIFQYDYKEVSLTLTPVLKRQYTTAEQAKKLLGTVQLVDWPFLRPAKIIGVFDASTCITLEKGKIIQRRADGEVELMFDLIREKRGIMIPKSVSVGVMARCTFMNRANSTMFHHEFRLFPAEMLLEPSKNIMKRYVLMKPHMSPHTGDKVVVAAGDYLGRPGTIVAHDDKRALVDLDPIDPIDRREVGRNGYLITVEDIAKETEIPPDIIRKALATLPIAHRDARDANLSLTLYGGPFVLDGFCLAKGNELLFSDEAMIAIKEWLEYTRFTSQLIRVAPFNVKIDPNELGKTRGEQDRKIFEIIDWIKGSSLVSLLFLIPKSCIMATSRSTALLEATLMKLPPESKEKLRIKLPLDSLIWKGCGKRAGEKVTIGRQCACIADIGTVKFGTVGTVVGYDNSIRVAYCIADREIPLGSNLRCRLRTRRGFVVKADDLICI